MIKSVFLSAYLSLLTLSSCVSVRSTCTESREAFRQRCLAFEPETHLQNATRTRLEFLAASSTLELEDNPQSCNRPSQKVASDACRVALQIPTSSRSSISFELWLPRRWNHRRYLATGNGGIDGCIKYEDVAYGAANGFATMGTNNGHNGSSGVTMYHNPDVVEDFSYRALTTGTLAAKRLINEFYGQSVAHSYYIGCSLGGRMGVSAAEAFPEDYDGIVAGSPAVDFNHLQGERAMFYPITGAVGSSDFISAEMWTGLIHDEVLKQCDELDGVGDGIIEIPDRCHFDPTVLLCKTGQSADCLNSNQVAQLEKIYATYTYSDGTLIFPRMNPGNEKKAVEKLLAGAPFSYSQDWFRYVVNNDPSWDASTYGEGDVRRAEQLNPFDIRTFPKTLPRFKTRGGKMISYHGGQDHQITSFNTERFWDQMSAADPDLHNYYRFFRISGMFHCSGGPGAWVFGQGGNGPAVGIPFDPEHNVLAAMVRWVESGQAPEVLRGTKFIDDDPEKGLHMQRDHCLYPRAQTYVGGDHRNPTSWECRM